MPVDYEAIALDCTHAPFRAQQKPKEFGKLLEMAAGADTVLEIGSYKGGTIKGWTRVCSEEATIIGIDLPGGEFGGGFSDEDADLIVGLGGMDQTIHLIPADSHLYSTRRIARWLIGGKEAGGPFGVDVLFIDGDHTYEGVKKDYEMYSPLVRKGGIIALHDIIEHVNHPGVEVHRFWEDLKKTPGLRYEEAIDLEYVSEFNPWGGIGIITV